MGFGGIPGLKFETWGTPVLFLCRPAGEWTFFKLSESAPLRDKRVSESASQRDAWAIYIYSARTGDIYLPRRWWL